MLEDLSPTPQELSEVIKNGQAWARAKALPFPAVVVNGRVSGDLSELAVFITEDFGALGSAWYTRVVERQKKKETGLDFDEDEITDVIRELIFPEKRVKFLSAVYHPALFPDEEQPRVLLPIDSLRQVANLEIAPNSGGPRVPLHVLVVVGGTEEELDENFLVVEKVAAALKGRSGAIITVVGVNSEVNAKMIGCVNSLDGLRSFNIDKCSQTPAAVDPNVNEAASRLVRSAHAEDSRGVVLVINGRRTEVDVNESKPILVDLLTSLLAPYEQAGAQEDACVGLDPIACSVAFTLVQSLATTENPHREVIEEGLDNVFDKAPLAGFDVPARGRLIAEITGSVDPLTDAGRRALATINHISEALEGFGARLVLAPQEQYTEYPLKSWHRMVVTAESAEFDLMPTRNTLTLGLDVLPNWQVSSLKAEVDLDNIRLTPVDQERVEAQ
ncbi:hypothetical protein Pmar_PMAR023796 [Perkinsus marinus ATCC 50983]|uniref:Uncharacterized protein n=1 Tax=Perkinsus marinus (strain ATCC 50983 / TXsc) TaxID=423536 RepID=C5L8R3_PERM5|nr:hypothetical protein Pmar_PMAR023796 [Perkinsus marinus ATCC 50983]EER06880.1 hypothetical protein Pmar_PMAR023796 [Perkinsus marinus ATCC 50983]|eukprot:XP_002775064.1 hypothetical protein Pmar_PMAR023796 [Perkinsus marinus ATCC 50983]